MPEIESSSERVLADEEIVSQYGNRGKLVSGRPFKCRPELPMIGLSVLLGRWTPERACERVERNPKMFLDTAGVRHAVVGKLRAAGFVVSHTRTQQNRDAHGSVKRETAWDDSIDVAFDRCFDEPIWWQDVQGNE